MHMEQTPVEVRVWHRANRPPQLTIITGACDSVIRLTPEQADDLAADLLFYAQFVRHHTRRQRGADMPLRHMREDGNPCPFTLPRDVTHRPDTFHPELMGAHLPPCNYCVPSPPLDGSGEQACTARASNPAEPGR
jgi:hypothetical protein